MPKLYLLNSLITPFRGVRAEFYLEKVTGYNAKLIFLHRRNTGYEIISALGHEGTVKAMKALFGEEFEEIKYNRIAIEFEPEDEGLALVLRERIPEGVVLTEYEMRKIGYDMYYIKRIR